MPVLMAVEHCAVWLFLLWGSHHGGWATFQGMIDEDLPEQLSAINKTALRSSPGSTLCLIALPLWVGNRSDKHVLSRRHRPTLSNGCLVWWKPIWSCVTGGGWGVSKWPAASAKVTATSKRFPPSFILMCEIAKDYWWSIGSDDSMDPRSFLLSHWL